MTNYKERRIPFLVPALINVGGLRPDAAVLDVGCGPGAFAQALTEHLTDAARFEGLDIMPKAIRAAEKRVARANFRFQVADIYNGNYNPAGKQRAESYTFPFPDATFDFVYALSVFTHMELGAVGRYLFETARVLKPGGRCFITYYLISAPALANGRVETDFPSTYGAASRVRSLDVPEAAIAHQMSAIDDAYKAARLTILPPVHFGRWAGNKRTSFDKQDAIVAEKAREGTPS